MDKVNCLARLTLKEQMKDIDNMMNHFPEYSPLIHLHRDILQILLPLEDQSILSANAYIKKEGTQKIVERAISEKKHISSFLNINFLDKETIQTIVKEISHVILKNIIDANGLEYLINSLEHNEIHALDGVVAFHQADIRWITKINKKYGFDEASLLFIFSKPLQPFHEELARIFDKELSKKMEIPFCPICGQIPVVARVKERKRFMTCMYCGAEYMVDQFTCQYCGNNDPNTLGFIIFEPHREYELNYCEKCKHYIKIIHENKEKKKIPKGLEDIITQHIDILAKKQDDTLIRA